MAIDNKKIHQHLESVLRINTGLAIASLLVVGLLFIWLKFYYVPVAATPVVQPNGQAVNVQQPKTAAAPVAAEPADGVDQAQLAEDYRTGLNSALAGLSVSDSSAAESMSFKILDLMVPAEFKNLQLEIVIGLNEIQQGKTEEAGNRFERLREQYTWLLPNFSAT